MRNFILIIGLILSWPSLANWQLLNEKSQFNIVTTKANNGTEVHQFTQLKGDISAKGDVTLTIDLNSIESNIAIRNERMKEFLFETNLFPQATFTTLLNQQDIDKIKVGELTHMALSGEINLHGAKQKVNTQVQVIKLSGNKLIVSSMKPVIIQAAAFNLVAGVEKLQSLAGLPSISNAVPITFSLYFTK